MKRARGEGQICEATRLGEKLHLFIDSAIEPTCGVRQGKISVHESKPRVGIAIDTAETAMLKSERIAEVDHYAPRIRCSVGNPNAMV